MKISIMVRSRIDQNALHEPKTLIKIYCYSLRSQKKTHNLHRSKVLRRGWQF